MSGFTEQESSDDSRGAISPGRFKNPFLRKSCSQRSSSSTETERVVFETDLDFNVVGIRIEETQPISFSASITFTAPMPAALDAVPQQLDWPGNFKPGAGAIAFTEHRPATTTFEIDTPPIDAIGQEDNRGTFTMSGGEVDRMEDGSEVTVATPEADVRGCFRLYGGVQPI